MAAAQSEELPLGYVFQPSDIDICELLTNKTIDSNYSCYPVYDGHVYGAAPWDLPVIGAEFNMGEGLSEHQYYFVISKSRVLKAGNGRWIANSKDKPIVLDDEQQDDVIAGYKRTFTYYISPKGRQSRNDDIKTKWIMHEYRLHETAKTQWALCKIGETGTTGSSGPSVEAAGYEEHQQPQQQQCDLGSIAEMEVDVQASDNDHDQQQSHYEDQHQQHLQTTMMAATNYHGVGSEDQPACLLSIDPYQPTSLHDWNVPTMDDLFNELLQQNGQDQGQSAGFSYFNEYQQAPTEVWNI